MLDCPVNLELYKYEIGDKIIVLDVQSSFFFVIDELTSQIIDLAEEYITKDIINILEEKYQKGKIIDRLNKLDKLWEEGKLNSSDRFQGGLKNFWNYELKLHPSSNCNLNCVYCFGEKIYSNKRSEISIKTAKDAINFLVYEFGSDGGEYKVDLTGSGEALLRFDFIKEINKYCERLSQKIGKRILVSLCTNGTLLSKEKSSYLKNNKILYGVSVDGGELIHDNLRPYKNGQGTFKDVINNCRAIENREYLGFAVTLTGEYTNVKDIFLKLYQLDLADTIGIKPIRLPPDQKYSINKENIEKVKEGYNELALYLIQEVAKGKTDIFYTLLRGDDYFGKFLKRTIRHSRVIYRCSAGLNSFSVNATGDIYNCPVEINNDKFKMGNIYKGVDKEEQERLRGLYADNIRECKGCWARYLCAGECFAVGNMIHGRLEKPFRAMCEYKKHLIRLSMYFWTELKEMNPAVFDSVYQECSKKEW